MHVVEPIGAASRAVLAEHVSVPLGDSVKLVNKISQNFAHGDVLAGGGSKHGGVEHARRSHEGPCGFYAAAGIAPGDVIQTDGSGLSRHDLVTPRAVVTLLKYAQGQPWFAPYFASLPVAGVDGTLEALMKTHAALAHSREDWLGGACADSIGLCGHCWRAAGDFFVPKQQSGREEP